jgi:hypothetical protein
MSILKTGRPSKNKEKLLSSVRDNIEFIKMNVNIPKSLHKKIKQKTLDEDTTVTELVITALDEVVSK